MSRIDLSYIVSLNYLNFKNFEVGLNAVIY